MTRFKYFFWLLSTLLWIPLVTFSQQNYKDHSFTRIDSFAKTVKFKKNVYQLTKELTDPYPEQLEKTRAIFVWITENIRYDYKFYNSGKEIKTPECKDGMNCEQLFLEWENKYINRILKKKKGICGGYSRLFKKMCDIAGITCEIIEGYTRTNPYQVGNPGNLDHAWNVIYIDSAYFLLDATWAAGGCIEDEESGKLLSYKKNFNNYYWLTPFHEFTRNHYPKNGKWVFEPNYTKEKFAANPYYSSDIISKITLITPHSGIIDVLKGDTLRFKFKFSDYISHLQVNTNVTRSPDIFKWESVKRRKKVLMLDTLALKKQKYIHYTLNDDIYEFEYVVTDESIYYLDILFEYRRVMRFKINIVKKAT